MTARQPRTPGGGATCLLRGVACSLRGRTVTLVIDGRLRRADVRSLHRVLATPLEHTGAEFVACDVKGLTAPDVDTVDVLARLRLTALRSERQLLLDGAPPRLRELLVLTGLEDALLPARASGLEPGREPEQREEPLGVEEGVQSDDHAV
ncbi:MAG: STAS domain-containing protein [Nitriliruptorales bacterium]